IATSGADGADTLRLLDEALALWRGPALAEFADRRFAQPEAVRLEELRLTARERRAELLLRLGRARRPPGPAPGTGTGPGPADGGALPPGPADRGAGHLSDVATPPRRRA